MVNSFLLQAIIYLGAAVVCVPIAKRLGMGSVLGYLIAGILIGPYLLGFIGEEGEDIMHFAEFGVVMMLFLIGLDLEPARLWKMKSVILGSGVSQVLVTGSIFFSMCMLLQFSWQASLAIGLSLALSSTAIVLQSLKENNQMETPAGRQSFAVLLMQDIAVIPLLAILPLLAISETRGVADTATDADTSPWLQTLLVLGAVAAVIVAGRYIISPILGLIARTKLRELFTASALLIVVAIAYLMHLVGVSPALGAFLAGVVLGSSSFKHELESDLDPFKGLLLGLFFIAVGASINFGLIANNAVSILSATLLILLVKAIVLLVIGRTFRLASDQNLRFAIGLSQVGEFAFVTFSFGRQLNILDSATTDMLMAITALSMTITPVLVLINEKWLLPRASARTQEQKASDPIDEHHKVIIAGFSHFGSTIGRFLRANGVRATILDHNSDTVNFLTRMGFKVYYGDATRVELLQAAGADKAHILISAIGSPETNLLLAQTARKHFPHLRLMFRARNRVDAYELMELQVDGVYREHVDTSVRLGKDALIKLGMRAHTVHRLAQNFLKYDEAALSELAHFRGDDKTYISQVRRQIEIQEMLLSAESQKNFSINDHAWDSEELRIAAGRK